jgi:hypothetical protein
MIEGMATDESRWVENWSMTGPLLEERRRRERRTLSAERALSCAEALFSMPWPEEVLANRRRQSGLLQQQDLFRRLHSL